MARRAPASFRQALGLAVCLTFLASCGQQSDNGSVNPRPLRVIIGSDVASPDPQLPFDAASWAILGNVFEALVGFDASLRVEPELASHWVNPSQDTWRFYLDPAARFSDGTALRAGDVKFSIERLKGLIDSELHQFTRHIASVETIDDLTVDIKTSGPKAILNSLAFIPILSEQQISQMSDQLTELPMGTGPYRVSSRQPGRTLTLAANQHHANPPVVKDVTMDIFQGEEQLHQIEESKPDLTLLVGQRAFEGLSERTVEGLTLVRSPGLSVFYVTVNVRPTLPDGRRNPLSDERVRRALALATNQQELVDEVLLGRGRAVSQLVIPQVFGFNPELRLPSYDPDAARALLEEAGHPQLEVSFLDLEASSQRVPELLIEQWGRVGVRGSRDTRSPAEHLRALQTGSFQLTIEGWACSSADASEVIDFLLRGRDEAQSLGLTNHTGFSNPELNEIADNNLGVLDTKERLAALQRGLRIAAEQRPYLPLFAQDDVYVISDAVDWSLRVDGEVVLSDLRFRAGSAGKPR